MKTLIKQSKIAKVGTGLIVLTLLLAGCSDGASSSDGSSGAVTGVATPSKVSVVNTN